MQRGAKLGQIARARRREADAGQDPLEVSDFAQELPHGLVAAVFNQGPDRVQTSGERLMVADGASQPSAQQPAAHRGRGAIHDRGEGRGVVARKRVGDLEVAARDGVEEQGVVVPLEAQRRHVRQLAALRVAGVDDQRAGRTDREGAVFDLER